ncbi:MAG: GGDEF-domain containing protein [Sulfurovum sp.]|nr:MAG: GGDEF-domain containing protein [Sulfurovum sp.]
MNQLLEYQLKSIGYDGVLSQSQQLSLFKMVNESYDKARYHRSSQRSMLDTAKNKIQELRSITNDATDNKLFESEEKYQRLLSNLQPYYFFYTKSNEGRLISIGDSVSDMLGFSEKEFIDKYSDHFAYGLKSDIETKMLISEYGYNVPYELSLENKSGVLCHLEVTEYLIFNDENEILGIEGIVRDITEDIVAKNRISNMLYRDTLTGISNRLHLEVLMEKLIINTYNKNKTFSMLFLDLDYFKHINDTLGHDVGDLLLQQIAYAISDVIRANDIFARIGGDEFVIIFKDIGREELLITIEKLMKCMNQPWIIKEYELSVSASIGVVRYPEDGKTTIDLMKSADIAMYKAKSNGRNNFTFFKQEYNHSIYSEMELIQDMPLGLKNNEFVLYFQPKVSVMSNKIIAAEALIRWIHPKMGYIPPDKFIPLSESTGLILKLGRWVIEEACRSIAYFNECNPNKKLNVSINISIRQFQHENIYKILKENMTRYAIEGEQLSLEITESIMMENHEHMVQKLNELKTLNVNISLDDFGTGYSTLSYLHKLSIDELKIDKAFIDEIPRDGDKSIILDTIIAMGQTLDMAVVAEGVEHEYQRQYLKDKGCDIYQGYLFSKPLPKEEYISLYIL